MKLIFTEALESMHEHFSTLDFNMRAHQLGASKSLTKGYARIFLMENCQPVEGSVKLWSKKTVSSKLPTLALFEDEDVENAISILKRKGFKILKPSEVQYSEV